MVLFKQQANLVQKSHLCFQLRLPKRTYAKLIKEQDPEEVKNFPIFQYASKNTKRTNKIYMWGNAMFGALGNPSFIRPVSHPAPMKTMHKPWRNPFGDTHRIRDISCGYGFTVFAASHEDNDYSLFGTGLNSEFQIGYHCVRKGHPLEILAAPVPIVLPVCNLSTKAVKVACGRAHTVVITDKEGLFSMGNNAYGQCGSHIIKEESTDELSRIHKVEGLVEEISQVICGQDHTMFIGASGKVYSCGWGADGQTGLGHYNNQGIPTAVEGDIKCEKIVQLSSAADCVLALSDKGEVFGWGNSEYGQLNTATDQQQINIPRHLKLGHIGKVTQVASGGTICAVLNEHGDVYVWGYGILGKGPNVSCLKDPSPLPQPLFGLNEFETDAKVEQLTCSLTHFAAVTNKGHLYMWGRNRENCLGLGPRGDQFFPYRVSVPAEVQKVVCGVDHTATMCKAFA